MEQQRLRDRGQAAQWLPGRGREWEAAAFGRLRSLELDRWAGYAIHASLLKYVRCAVSMARMAYFTKCVIYHPRAPSPQSVLRILDSGTARECGVRPQGRHPLPSHPANHSPFQQGCPQPEAKICPSSQNWHCHMDSPSQELLPPTAA